MYVVVVLLLLLLLLLSLLLLLFVVLVLDRVLFFLLIFVYDGCSQLSKVGLVYVYTAILLHQNGWEVPGGFR